MKLSPPTPPTAVPLSTMLVSIAWVVAVVTSFTVNVVGNHVFIDGLVFPATSHGRHHCRQNRHQYSQHLDGGRCLNSSLKLTSTGVSSDDGITTTFNPPSCQVVIEYCTGCRWMLKSFWYAQELLSTFSKTDGLDAVTVLPSTDDKTGIFVVRLVESSTDLDEEEKEDGEKRKMMMELWDRNTMSGFPQPKDIKQKIRDVIDPNKYLGHSDTQENKTQQQQRPQGEQETSKVKMSNEVIDLSSSSSTSSSSSSLSSGSSLPVIKLDPEYTPSPSVTITYCTGCQWLLRAANLGQELLTTFNDGQIGSVTLVPSRPPARGGQFVSSPSCHAYHYSLSGVVCIGSSVCWCDGQVIRL